MQNKATTRTDRAQFCLQGAAQWLKIRTPDGRPLAYGIPSATRPDLWHRTNLTTCSCEDYLYNNNRCYHIEAVRLHVARVRAERVAA